MITLDKNRGTSEDSKDIWTPAEGTDKTIKSIERGSRSGFWGMCLHIFMVKEVVRGDRFLRR